MDKQVLRDPLDIFTLMEFYQSANLCKKNSYLKLKLPMNAQNSLPMILFSFPSLSLFLFPERQTAIHRASYGCAWRKCDHPTFSYRWALRACLQVLAQGARSFLDTLDWRRMVLLYQGRASSSTVHAGSGETLMVQWREEGDIARSASSALAINGATVVPARAPLHPCFLF